MAASDLTGLTITCVRPDYGLAAGVTYRIIAHDGSFVAVERDGETFGIRATGDFAGQPTIGLDRFRFEGI